MFQPARLVAFAILGFAAGLALLYWGARGTVPSPAIQCLIGAAIPGGFFTYYRWADARKPGPKGPEPVQAPKHSLPAKPATGPRKRDKKRKK